MAVTVFPIRRHFVQTSVDFTTWTARLTIECLECSEGAGQVVGSASLFHRFGTVREPGALGSPTAQARIAGLEGQWVRVLVEETGGAVNIDGVDCAPIWYGVVNSSHIADLGGGKGVQSWEALGIISDLAHKHLSDGWYEVNVGNDATFGTRLLNRAAIFNAPDGVGGLSTGTYVLDGETFNIANTGGLVATALDLLKNNLFVAGRWYDPFAEDWVGDVEWAVSDPLDLLSYLVQEFDCNGMSVLDCVNFLISVRRGMTYRVTVSGNVATINVRSASAFAIGKLAASTDTATPNLTAIDKTNVEISIDYSATFDRIDVLGGKVWTGMTVAYDPAEEEAAYASLVPAWTSAEETAWDDGAGTVNDKVWREFVVSKLWNGRQYDGTTGIAGYFPLDEDTPDYTGGRGWVDSSGGVATGTLRFTASLPCGQGFTDDGTGPRQESVAFWKPDGSTDWADLQSTPLIARDLTMDGPPASVALGKAHHSDMDLGNSQQLQNKNNLNDEGVMLVTLGVLEGSPLRVSWTRAQANWPRGTPRTLAIYMSDCELWQVLPGTVTKLDAAGDLVKTASLITIRNDLEKLQDALAFARAYYTEPAVTLSWAHRGTIDFAYGSGSCAPGALVTSATMGYGAQDVGSVVTRRQWILSGDGYGTHYSTARQTPDVEAVK